MSEAIELLSDGSVSVNQAVKEFGISRTGIYGLMSTCEFPFSKRGRKRLIPRLSLKRVVAAGMLVRGEPLNQK